MRKLLLTFIVFAAIVSGCDSGDDPFFCDFDEQGMLTNIADEIIIPRFETLSTGTTLLEGAIDAFVAAPDEGSLVEVRVTFVPTYVAYQRCTPFAFGPGLINGVPFRERFNTFPTNTALIESSIANGTSVANSGKAAVGFPAMEWLIFGDGTLTDAQIVELFVSDPNAVARKLYLQQLASELRSTTGNMLNGWQSYRSGFIANTGTADGSSISLLVNDFNQDYEILKNFKLKIPLGKFNGGVVIPSSVEGYYAQNSMRLINEQMDGLVDLYNGVGENNADGSGLYELVKCYNANYEGKDLEDEIRERLESIKTKLQAVPDPLSETLLNNKPLVDEAYQEIQMLVPLIKHEMTSAVSVQITYQSGDGD